MSGGMNLQTSFKLGKDPEDNERFKAAQKLAAELSRVACPWHNKSAQVQVAPGESYGDLVWAINGACCENFRTELAKLIEQAGG